MEVIDQVRSVLAPRYEVREEIGRGGSSVVFRATDTRHDRAVAIKVLFPDAWSAHGTDRFLREIRIAASLQHVNILPLFDSGEEGGLLYYVMPFVSGESLADRIRREGPLPIDEAVDITAEVSSGLAYAHSRGIIHRDIKPGNILLSDGRAIIADFGIARAAAKSDGVFTTSAGSTPGTPTYMSPEQAGGGEVDARSDLYSLGCVLFEALSGDPPFTGRTVQAVVVRHMTEPPPSLTVVRPGVPTALAEVVERTLQKVPADRYRNAEALQEALRRSLTANPARPRIKPGNRRWVRYAGVAALTLMLAVLGPQLIPRGPSLDQNRIVVFPLAPSGPSTEVTAGWDVALAIGTALEHTDPLRWSDGWLWLSPEVRRDPRALTLDAAREVARAHHAGWFLTGIVRASGDSSFVTLQLHSTTSDADAIQESAGGGANEPLHALAFQALVPALARLLQPGQLVDLSPLADRNPAAIALSLQGDRAYREARFEDAFDAYRRAVDEDSTFAIAAARAATTALWEEREQEGEEFAHLAVRHATPLPAAYRHYTRGVEAYLVGDATLARFYLDSALALQPEWIEPEVIRGEVYYHLFPASDAPIDDAVRAFQAAERRDSMFVPALTHLGEIELRSGNLKRAGSLIERISRTAPTDWPQLLTLDIMERCVAEGIPTDDAWEELVTRSPSAVLSAAHGLAVAGAQIPCAEAAYRSVFESRDPNVRRFRWGALLGLQSVLLAQGRVNETVALLGTALDKGIRGAYSLYLFDAPVSSRFDEGAAEAERISREFFGEGYPGARPSDLWLMGSWLGAHGESAAAAALADRLDSLGQAPGEREARLLGAALQAHAALARGDGDDAIERLRTLQPTAPLWGLYWTLGESLGIERILLARALLARGDAEEALWVASVFDHPAPVVFPTYLGPSLAIRERAATDLGRDDLAAIYRERLEALGWKGGEVSLSTTGPLLPSP